MERSTADQSPALRARRDVGGPAPVRLLIPSARRRVPAVRRPMSKITTTAPALMSTPTTNIPRPAQIAQPSLTPASASTSIPRAASAFITTAVQRPNSASQVTACSPEPWDSATQKSCSPGGVRGALPSCRSNSGSSPSKSISSSWTTHRGSDRRRCRARCRRTQASAPSTWTRTLPRIPSGAQSISSAPRSMSSVVIA